jgi:hypothetical protein
LTRYCWLKRLRKVITKEFGYGSEDLRRIPEWQPETSVP